MNSSSNISLYSPVLLAALLSTACGMPSRPPSIMTPALEKDASSTLIDVGSNPNQSPDAQTPDLGLAPDTGINLIDAGFAQDANSPLDAGFTQDANSPPDAGFTQDANIPPDTGITQDANIPSDAGLAQDANMPLDAGFIQDANVPPDAGQAATDAGQVLPPVGDLFDAANVAIQIATAQCAFYDRCEPFRSAHNLSTQTQCTTEQSNNYSDIFNVYAQAISAANMAFSQSQFDTCLLAFGNADCELGLDPDACDFFTGQRTQGQACQYNLECAPDQYCSAAGVAICGMCTPRATLGQSCTNDRCVDNSICAQTTSGLSICVPNSAAESANCGSVGTGYCRGRLQCVLPQAGATTPSCVRPAQPGQACSQNPNNSANCNFAANQLCVNSVCATITWATPGQSCAGANICNIDGTCDQVSDICLARPTNFQPCINNICAQGHYCDTNLCRTQLSQAASCTGSNECTGQLNCLGPTGNQTCENLSWRACP
jgi:hypothetical protein